ncbi:lysylphosphatidylglycerol synthetase family protein [Natronococcus pandeyae]|uniref:Lysylphosphatidylglycerol synthetase family protein n=1 Tax=Natronococcus pandeyae TaxID=2055836 RepID=A0A8J8Q5I6_9EURY|nr:flippase-like domain-containing protein [Natronococcus pandeyae]TYL39437.1 lysylphosphatidylglycerol synthetase family protein [Natronococcus pandeyae]
MTDPDSDPALDSGFDLEFARVASAFAVAVVLLAVLVGAFGWEDVLLAAARADLAIYAIGFAAMIGCLSLRGVVWDRILESSGYDGAFPPVLGLYLATRFAKYVTPYGQVVAPPGVAYVLTQRSSVEYEEGLAAIVGGIFVNYLPYYTFGGFGLAYLLLYWRVAGSLWTYAVAFLATIAAVVVVAALLWFRRDAVETVLLAALSPVRSALERIRPSLADPLRPEPVRNRLDGFYRTLETISADRTTLLAVLVIGHLAWFLFALPLYLTALAMGEAVPLALAILVVALSKVGFVAPTPGGLGGVELTIAGVLALLAPVDAATAFAIGLLYRVVAYWLAVVVGGIAAIALSLWW